MKKIKYSLFAFVGVLLGLFFAGCSDMGMRDGEIIQKEGVPLSLTFMVDMAPQKEVKLGTRAVDNATSVQHLFLFVFDENGLYLETVKAAVGSSSQQIDGNTFYPYKATLHTSDKKRIIHFIGTNEANLIDQYVTPDKQKLYKGKSEGELVAFYITDKHVFWNRQEYISGISGSTSIPPISLIRNFARISIVNNAPSSQNFTLTGYAIHNATQQATVAPFNNSNYRFEIGRVTEPPKVVYLPLNASTLTFIPATESTDIFERVPSFVDAPFYFILNSNKGYYKIGLQDPDKLELLPVIRNHHYVLSINKVLKNGYSTAQEAMDNPPAGNASISIALADYPKISDGKSTLEVDKIAFYYTEGSLDFKANYIYKPDVTDPIARAAQIEVSLKQESTRKVLEPSSIFFDTTEQPDTYIKIGKVTGTIVTEMPNPGDIYTAIVRLRAGSLVREIKVYLSYKQEYPIQPVLTSYGYNAGDEATITFNIPEDAFSSAFYPIEFLISSKFLNPNLDPGKNSNLTLVDDGSGNFKYKYKALAPGNQTIYMKRNLSNKSEQVFLSSLYYKTAILNLSSGIGGDFTHFRGKLEYKRRNGTIFPVPFGTELIAYPVTTTTNFRLEESGRYVFDLEPNALNSYSTTFKVILQDGRRYNIVKTKGDLTSNPDILLLDYNETSTGFLYRDNTSTSLTESGSFASSVAGVTLTKNSSDNRAYSANINSDLPDSQTIQFIFTVSGTGEKLIGTSTVKDLRAGKRLIMRGNTIFKMRFSFLSGGNNTALTGTVVSSDKAGVTVKYSGREYDYNTGNYYYIYNVTVGATVSNTENVLFSSSGYTALVQVGSFENYKQIRLRAANPGTSTKTLTNKLWFQYYNNWLYVPTGTSINVTGTGIDDIFNSSLSAMVPTEGGLRLVYPNDMPNDATIKLSATIWGITYTGTTTLSNIKSSFPNDIDLYKP